MSTSPKKLEDTILRDDAENLHQAIGLCIQSWSEVEVNASILFEELIGGKPEMGFVIWDSVISFEAKLKALNAVVDISIKSERRRLLWKLLADKISAAAKLRNEIAHSGMIEDEDDDGFPRMSLVPYLSMASLNIKDKPRIKWMFAEEVRDRASYFRELANCVSWFRYQRMTPKRLTLTGARQAPHLILDLQKKAAQKIAKRKPRRKSSRR